ncbi:hypothetical protein [Vibrio vulnificus]|uniref:hypothetical protein n=1 Tax=Vibrio vulnificus TaxID=672 RepID=UPI0019D4CE4B|nr:hypothetical protein [Vibrio vulnificus]MBN8034959.1 hypothetical protein [Vibrio vulnificus]
MLVENKAVERPKETNEPLEIIQKIVNFIKSLKFRWLVVTLLVVTVLSTTATYYFVVSGAYELTQKAIEISPVIENLLSIDGFILDPVLWATVPMLYVWSLACLFYKAIKKYPEEYTLLVDIINLIVGSVGSVVMTSGAWLLGIAIAASIHYFKSGVISLALSVAVILIGYFLRSLAKPNFDKDYKHLDKHSNCISLLCFVLGSFMWVCLALSEPFGLYSSIYQEISQLSVK